MKICLFGISEIKTGRHNLKDPRLDLADKLVEADKKTCAQVDVAGEEDMPTADSILTSEDAKPDLILRDLEFVETRLGRNPPEEEQAVLEKIRTALEAEKFVRDAGLTEEELKAVTVHNFVTLRPITVATRAELAEPEKLLLRAVAEGGYISFLTVGGKENRAWLVRKGVTAWESASAIHSDIQKGFIRAEIINFADFEAAGGETEAKRAGKQRLETKSYVVQDYDLVNFRFNK
jgi:hypothetical protein